MDVRDPQLNHLCFEDDTIMFTSIRAKTLKHIIQTLKNYEKTSG